MMDKIVHRDILLFMYIHTRDPIAKKLGLEVTGVGKQRSTTGVAAPRTLPVYAVVYLTDGWYEFRSDAHDGGRVSAGDAFFLFPGIAHTYTPGAPPSLEYWFIFEGYILDRYRENGILSPAAPVFPVGKSDNIVSLWDECLTMDESRTQGFHVSLARRATAILQEVIAAGEHRDESTAGNDIARIIHAMRSNVREMDFDFEGYCTRGKLSVQYTRRRFKRETGYTPGAYFAQIKLGTAKERLVTSDGTVVSIANALGFDDQYYFSRWFTKLTSLSPTDYRMAFRSFGADTGR
ncbi:MAG: AraC family transcriptional regulator [Spirochaetota bacterium]